MAKVTYSLFLIVIEFGVIQMMDEITAHARRVLHGLVNGQSGDPFGKLGMFWLGLWVGVGRGWVGVGCVVLLRVCNSVFSFCITLLV